MLKLTKSVSAENYPISPQTSAVRKLTVRAPCSGVADLSKSYLVVKNTISTTVNGQQVVRNVGWGASFAQNDTWQYPASCQIKSAKLTCGPLSEYVEDVNIRVVNMSTLDKSAAQQHMGANVGSWGFQHIGDGARAGTADPATVVMTQGLWRSVFLDEAVSQAVPGAVSQKTGASYKEVAGIIYLGDIFKFAVAQGSDSVAVGLTPAQEVVIELQFEDVNVVLAELVNMPTNLTNPAAHVPYDNMAYALDPATLTNADGSAASAPANAAEMLTKQYKISTVSTYNHAREVPLYVGQPIATWKDSAAPAVVGANISQVQSISVPSGGGVATITFGPYKAGTEYIRTAGAYITPAQYFAELVAGVPAATVVVALTGINDPLLVAGANTTYTNLDAGRLSTYSVSGLECVLVERPGAKAEKQTRQYLQYLRDTDTIPAGQTYYQKSFMLDPGCVAAFAVIPPKLSPASAQDNMLSLSFHPGVSTGLSYRNLLDGRELYSRDVSFSSTTDAVEPLYLHRLIGACSKVGLRVQNLDPTILHMAKNGITAQALIAEPIDLSADAQQLNLRLRFTTNLTDRTVYVYKAVLAQVQL